MKALFGLVIRLNSFKLFLIPGQRRLGSSRKHVALKTKTNARRKTKSLCNRNRKISK